MISPADTQRIQDATRIEDVVGDFVQLKKRGVNLLGLCPFHNEKTPSFNVNPARNIFKCFGCGEAGDSISFLMKLENLTYPDALRWLAKKYHIEIHEEAPSQEVLQQQKETDSLFLINNFAQKYFENELFHTDQGKSIGLSYFKERGFREETIRKWQLGYSPDVAEGMKFTKEAAASGYKTELLQKAGLTSQSGRDFFRSRVIFTIHNLSGKIAGFAGRILVSDKKQPKYLNTPESEIYHKSKILYGAYFAKQPIRKADECLLVEGYTDVISLHQSGIENVVASSGTSLTTDQVSLIRRLTLNITIVYDGDLAGIKAALRGMDLVLEQDMNVRIVLLPDGHDPDSYIQLVGAAAFEEYISKEKKDFILFKTNLLLADTEGDPIKKAALVKEVINSIILIPDAFKRAYYLKECSVLMDISEQTLIQEANKLLRHKIEKKHNENKAPLPEELPADAYFQEPETGIAIPTQPKAEVSQKNVNEQQEKDITKLLLLYGHLPVNSEGINVAHLILSETAEWISFFENKLYAEIIDAYKNMMLNGEATNAEIWINHPNKDYAQFALENTLIFNELSSNWETKYDIFTKLPENNYVADVNYSLNRLKFLKVQGLVDKVSKDIKSKQGGEIDFEEIKHLMEMKIYYDKIKADLAIKLGNMVIGDTNFSRF